MRGNPISEVDAVTFLQPLGVSHFGYALRNGTVGVYKFAANPQELMSNNYATRLWRMASKNQVRSMRVFEDKGGRGG